MCNDKSELDPLMVWCRPRISGSVAQLTAARMEMHINSVSL